VILAGGGIFESLLSPLNLFNESIMSDDQAIVTEDDNQQVEVRKQKLAKLRDGAQVVYPNDFKPSHSVTDVFAQASNLSDEELHNNAIAISVAGRIMAIRRMGKASFFQIQDRRGRLQIYARKDKIGDDAYELFQTLDIGDLVGVSGHVFRTKIK